MFDTDQAGQESFSSFMPLIDTLVMGRRTYEETLKLVGQDGFYPDQQKVVFTHRPLTAGPDVTTVSGDVVSTLQQLRQTPGRGIWIVGGGQLVADLLQAGLLDELWVQIAPVLLGRGKPLFPAGDYAQRLTLVGQQPLGELTELHLRRRDQ
ncbi:MAG: dihydrofolate reductase family protein [Lactobacillus sp.]|nr:dihydrofolate reductase family protein [Lactobacillus sp.]